jgi:hypothetical protein
MRPHGAPVRLHLTARGAIFSIVCLFLKIREHACAGCSRRTDAFYCSYPTSLLLLTRVSSSYTHTHCSRTPQTLSHSYNAHQPLNPPTLCLWYAQTKAWKAGHKRENSLGRESSMPAQSRSAVRQAARILTFMTDDHQVRQCAKLSDLAELSGS